MIDNEIEKFTATSAVEAGLIDAIQHGKTVVAGQYTISNDGYLTFRQRNFAFADKSGVWRIGKFADSYQLMNFCDEFRKLRDRGKVNGID